MSQVKAGTLEWGLGAVAILAAVVFVANLSTDAATLRLVAKPVPALCFAAWVAARGRVRAARPIAIGLVLSALGDALLERDRFLAGLLAFLAAHLAYVAGFLLESRRLAGWRALPFVLWILLGFVVMRPGLGSLAVPVAAYQAAIAVMMWRAAATVGAAGAPRLHEWLGLAGAVLFGASDTLLGLDRFRGPIDGVRIPIIGLYWLGLAGIGAFAVLRPGYAPPLKGDP